MSLRFLPYEVVTLITETLDLDDIFHLALSCRQLHYLIYDDRRCRVFLRTLAPESCEAREASAPNATDSHYARAFRRLIKRRQAIRTATPFTAAVVAIAESWLYNAGVLCYLQERTTLRVLDLHASASTETVVDVRGLLCEADAQTCYARPRKSKLVLLNCAAGLVTCLYRCAGQCRLVVIHVAKRRLVSMSPVLETAYKIFVRNDADFLYYGTHSEVGEDGFRRWVLLSYDIRDDRWRDQKIHLRDIVGSDIGQSICFEIIDGSFYGLSNQTSFESDELDWTSYYHCFRFPVRDPGPSNTERAGRERMWRRQHAEGPIDDRWSFIRLTKDEVTGQLQILESRKEWLNGSSSSQRTYYRTDLTFEPPQVEEDEDEDDASDAASVASTDSSSSSSSNSITIDTDSGYGGGFSSTMYPSHDSSGHPHASASHLRTNHRLPRTTRVRPRDPHKTHTGDDASTALLFTCSKSPVRSYHASAQAFLDLVDDPAPSAPSTQRLRLRAGARRPLPGAQDDARLPRLDRVRRLYRNEGANEIAFWPPAPSSAAHADDAGKLAKLGRVLNPSLHTGPVTGAWDERSVVYSVASSNGLQAVVFLGFDPAVRLPGLQEWSGEEAHQPVLETGAEAEAPQEDAAALSNAKCRYMQAACHCAEQHEDEEEYSSEPDCSSTDGKGKGKGKQDLFPVMGYASFGDTWGPPTVASDAAFPQTMSGASPSGEEEQSRNASTGPVSPVVALQQPAKDKTVSLDTAASSRWTWIQTAMYRDINFGFNSLPAFSQETLREGRGESCGS